MLIQALPKHVADLIAAGEVVERPASVVKELCENALDAGAAALTVEIRGGGVQYIRVTDNGHGIARDEVRAAFQTHATSKIRSADDLERIMTLGFRGEALASIAAVARVQLLSCAQGEAHGLCYEIESGDEISLEEAGCPAGTTMIIRDLFYKTPARMKFLKKDVTEGNFVGAALERVALSRPDAAITFIREGKQIFNTPGDGNAASAVRAVLGKSFYENMLGVKNTHCSIEVTGFVCLPAAARPNRNQQYFFLNGRYIKCPTASAALGEAYKHSVMAGKHPSCVLYITLPPGLVDVNVYPAKTEVRFADDRPVFTAVYQAARGALSFNNAQAADSRPAIDNEPKPKPAYTPPPIQKPIIPHPSFLSSHLSDPDAESNPLPPVKDEPSLIIRPVANPVPLVPDHSPLIINCVELFQAYILAELADELLLIDKHAAHERIIFEQLKAQQGEVRRQVLLSPLPLNISREESAILLEHSDLLREAGFAVEAFGDGSAVLRECPMLLCGEDLNSQMMEIAGYLLSSRQDVTTQALDWMFHSAACRAAVKAGDLISQYEREQFAAKVLAMPGIRHCPHGRPVVVSITKKELEKRFGR